MLAIGSAVKLYLFPFLHQATTFGTVPMRTRRCISSLFYIKPQLQYLTDGFIRGCISSLFYIKPQLVSYFFAHAISCISSLFYIKPQLKQADKMRFTVVSLPFSTSSHNPYQVHISRNCVVSLPFSTSSHNLSICFKHFISVVSLPFSTSSHN